MAQRIRNSIQLCVHPAAASATANSADHTKKDVSAKILPFFHVSAEFHMGSSRYAECFPVQKLQYRKGQIQVTFKTSLSSSVGCFPLKSWQRFF